MKLLKPVSILVGALVIAHGAFAQGDADAGKSKTLICGACHGADGNSVVPTNPSLAGLGGKYLLKQLNDIKSGEREVVEMTGLLSSLSDQDLADIAAYYASQAATLAGAKEQQVKLNSGQLVDGLVLGENLYRFGNAGTGVAACTGCHSPTGQGNAPAGYPRLSGQHAAYVAKQLTAFRNGERVNDGENQVMRGVAKNLSDSEIAAVANYIAGLN